MNADTKPQLTFDVKPHPEAKARAEAHDREVWLEGAISFSGDLRVDRDLNPGDELTLQVANADGEIIATGEADVTVPSFPPIKAAGEVVGQIRKHKAKIR